MIGSMKNARTSLRALLAGLLVAGCGGAVADESRSDGSGRLASSPGDSAVVGAPAQPPAAPQPSDACGRLRTAPPQTDKFARMAYALAAHWQGNVQFPRGWVDESRRVDVDFRADGHYGAHCVGTSSDCLPFYYGSVGPSPLQRYELIDIKSNGEGWGEIDIFWDVSGDTTRGSLEHIVVSDDMTTLTFEFWATWAGRYGPGKYDLRCAP